MDDDQLAGQLILLGMPSTSLPAGVRTLLADRHVGGVFLFGNSDEGVAATRELTDEAHSLDPSAHLIVTADQEGGEIQRLRGSGFDAMPSAVSQAAMSDADLKEAATRWARQLREAGVDMDLAPVADVVPEDVGAANKPIFALHRGYGSDPGTVAAKVSAYIEGMHAAGIGTSAKHFPGLGQVEGNTDFVKDVTDDRTTRDDPYLATFAAAIDAGTETVMIATATYAKIDGKQATFSPTVIKDMLRGDLGFDGVVVSDDMNGAQVRDLPPGTAAWRYLSAGGDLITIGDAGTAAAMLDAITDRMHDPGDRAQVERHAVRVLAMKVTLGLATCAD